MSFHPPASSTSLYDQIRWNHLIVQAFTNELPDPDGVLTFNIFHDFKKLPLELRRKIWRETFPGPRLLHLDSREEEEWDLVTDDQLNPKICRAAPPVAHAVNQESREVVLFECKRIPSRIPGFGNKGSEEYVLFSPSRDTLHIAWKAISHYLVSYSPEPPTEFSSYIVPELRGWVTHHRDTEFSNSEKTLFGDIRRLILWDLWGEFNAPDRRFSCFEFFKLFGNLDEIRLIRKTVGLDPLDINFRRQCGEHEKVFTQLTTDLASWHAKDPDIKIPVITSWDMHFKYDVELPELYHRYAKQWFRRRVDYYDLVPVVGLVTASTEVHVEKKEEIAAASAKEEDEWWKGPIPKVGVLPKASERFQRKCGRF